MLLNNLSTPRLIFRELQTADLPTFLPFWSDPISMQGMGGVPEDVPAFGEAWIARQRKRYAEKGTSLAIIADKESGEIIGQCGLIYQHVDGEEQLEVGYHLLAKFRGKGYAIEAAKACRDFAFENNLAEQIISIIEVNNVPSQQVARNNGMDIWKKTAYKGFEVLIFRITKATWNAQQYIK